MSYYSKSLSGTKLRECYEIATPRIRQYLEAEIRFVCERLRAEDHVLELGCGYGRVAQELAKTAARVVGIDTAGESLALARKLAEPGFTSEFVEMDAMGLGFPDREFDAVVCVQNGICSFKIDYTLLLREAMRVTRPGGRIILSSYAERFWHHRLEWFELQAAHGLVGKIDRASTGNGVIVCTDGFRSGTMNRTGFEALCAQVGIEPMIVEVDRSSLFCELIVPRGKADAV